MATKQKADSDVINQAKAELAKIDEYLTLIKACDMRSYQYNRIEHALNEGKLQFTSVDAIEPIVLSAVIQLGLRSKRTADRAIRDDAVEQLRLIQSKTKRR